MALVAVNVVVYLLAISQGGSVLDGPGAGTAIHYGAVPHELTHGHRLPALASSLFLHGSFLHIFADVLSLAIFGPTLEDSLGRSYFLGLYLLGGLLALAVQVLVEPSSTVPVLGASGAIAAVLGGYLLLYPRARVISLFLIPFFATIVEVPALILLSIWLLVQLYVCLHGLAGPLRGGEAVAFIAHLAAFAFGLLAIRLLATRGDAGAGAGTAA